MNIKPIILAAGKGTRMRSETPKVLHPVGGKAMLHHVFSACEQLNASEMVVVVGHGAESVIDASNSLKSNIRWVQQEEQLGTGHAVAQTEPFIADDEIALVLYGDVPMIRPETLQALCDATAESEFCLLTATLDDPFGYGRIVRDDSGAVQCITEQKDADAQTQKIREINTGFIAVRGALLKRCLARLSPENAQQEYYLTDCVMHAVAEGASVKTVDCPDMNETQGVNDRAQQAAMERYYQQRQAKQLMSAGVTLLDPARLDVRGTLNVGRDVTIDVNAVFIGEVTLGDGVNIEANCVIKDSKIGNGVTIKSHTSVDEAVIGNDCDLGPFARIRPGTVLSAAAKVGNFVEIKKSTVGEGSKISHLSYIGDTTMGADVNIGAGTITCNYDGVNKHQTVIEDGVFVGSDTQLVAPVVIEKNATIGAGSTITRAVSEDQLSLSRAKQVSIADWKRPEKQK